MPHKIIQASTINHGNLTNVKHVITSEIAFCLGSDDHSFYHLLLLKSQQTTPQSALLAIVNIKQFVFIIFIIHQSVVAVSNINLTNLWLYQSVQPFYVIGGHRKYCCVGLYLLKWTWQEGNRAISVVYTFYSHLGWWLVELRVATGCVSSFFRVLKASCVRHNSIMLILMSCELFLVITLKREYLKLSALL